MNFLARFFSSRALIDRGVLVAVLIGSVLLFAHEPGAQFHRVWRLIWDCGHVFLFAGVGFLLGERYLEAQPWRRFAALLSIAVAVGWLIERLQLIAGRDYSLQDVYADGLGMVMGLLIGGRAVLRPRVLCVALLITALLGAGLLRFKPVVYAAIDGVAAARAFPELANFTTGFAPLLQSDRFGARRAWPRVTPEGLRVDFYPGEYPGFSLDDFPGDWRGYRELTIDLVNPGAAQTIVCRIHDGAHERSFAVRDRFNQRFELAAGVSRIRIDLAAVARAPQGRRMDMGDIRQLICFLPDLQERRTLIVRALALH